MKTIVTAGGDVRPTLALSGTSVPSNKTAAERLGPWVEENYDVPMPEAVLYLERLEAFLGREIDEAEADRLLEPVFNALRLADELRRVLSGGAVAIPFNERGGSSYVEVKTLDGELPGWVAVYEADLAESRRRSA